MEEALLSAMLFFYGSGINLSMGLLLSSSLCAINPVLSHETCITDSTHSDYFLLFAVLTDKSFSLKTHKKKLISHTLVCYLGGDTTIWSTTRIPLFIIINPSFSFEKNY
jgi:hypothetical protein